MPITLIFCLPGKQFSGEFLECWTSMITYCYNNNIAYRLSRKYSPVVNMSRCLCLGANVLSGNNQKPFQGRIQYDYLIWIDNDTIFTAKDVLSLIEHDVDIVAALQMMKGNSGYTCFDWDLDYYRIHGTMPAYTPEKIRQTPRTEKGLIEVDYVGFGLMVVKEGVFEQMEYPWFRPRLFKVGDGVQDMCSEDSSFCLEAWKLGFKVHVDPEVTVGHEKMFTI